MKARLHWLKAFVPSARQLIDYGATPRAVKVIFSAGHRGRPTAGHEKVVFDLTESEAMTRLRLFLAMGRHRTRPAVKVVWADGKAVPAAVEQVYEKTMLVARDVPICSVEATA